MLRAITLDNFRAFRHVELEFSKLNVFVGPNNSGKSSIISAINLIAQNIRRGTQEFSLALNGPYVELGTFHDTVHGHSAKSAIGIGFTVGRVSYHYKFRYRPQRREIDLIRAQISTGELKYEYTSDSDSTRQSIKSKKREQPTVLDFKARFHGFFLMPPGILYRDREAYGDAYAKLREINFRGMSLLDRNFSNFDSLGAFRAAPERTYHYTGEAPANVGRFGENVAQILASSASSRQKTTISMIKRVASWFRNSGIANDVTINSLTNRHFEIVVEDITGARNNIIDSGFGCSQVLPVIVGGYSLLRSQSAMRPGTYVVQEPEIHLHPTAAAHLGTFFSELAGNGVQCFVETHSENVVLRIARHVATGELSPEDVKIYWVSAIDGVHTATLLPLNSDGSFSASWPEGFFPTRAEETLTLARAASRVKGRLLGGE